MSEEVSITYEKLYEILRREKDNADIQKLEFSFYQDTVHYLNEKNKILDDARNKTDLFSAAERENTATQLRNVKRLIKELYNRRESKIISMAMNKSRTDTDIIDTVSLLPEERAFYDHLVQTMGSFRKGIYLNLVTHKTPHIPGLDIERYQKDYAESHAARGTADVEPYEPEAILPEPADIDDAPYVPESTIVEDKPSIAIPQKGGDKVTVKFLQETSKFVGKELEIYGPYTAGDITSLPQDIAKVLIARGSAQEV